MPSKLKPLSAAEKRVINTLADMAVIGDIDRNVDGLNGIFSTYLSQLPAKQKQIKRAFDTSVKKTEQRYIDTHKALNASR